MHEIPHASQLAFHGSLALFGAAVHALDAQRKGTTKSITDLAALGVMSSFSGVMFALIGLQFFPGEVYFTATLAGTGGYLGVEGMAIIVNFVKQKLK